MGFRPGERNLHDAVLGTVHAGGAGAQEGAKLAAVEMAPRALSRMIVKRELSPAGRTGPGQVLGVSDVDVDALLLHVEVNLRHAPGGLQYRRARSFAVIGARCHAAIA
jgi:hypothetical protein